MKWQEGKWFVAQENYMKFQFQDPHVYWKAARPMCSHIAHGCLPATPAELADGAQGAPEAKKV